MSKPFARPLLAAWLAGILMAAPVAPVFAQNPPQEPPSTPAPQTGQAQPTGTNMAPVSLGVAKYDFTKSPKAFPNIIAPYQQISIPEPSLVNSPKIEQLIHDGKLELSLQDAIELALENNIDIVVARYNPWLADLSILKTKSGSFGPGVQGGAFGSSTANLPPLFYDPLVTVSVSLDNRSTPVNNPFLSGVGTAALTSLISHTATYDTQVSQSFSTGTTATFAWNNQRGSTTSTFNTFDPFIQSSLSVAISQQLLRGFGRFVNRRNIIIAKNNRKIADLVFAQQAITSITNVINAYWELVYARENVQVQQQAVSVAEKLYNDNRKQLEIGTMAPLDVTRAESELATDRQNLIVAQTVQLQDQQTLKNLIAKDPLSPNLINVELVPSDQPTPPAAIEAPSFEASVKEALANRPDLREQVYNLENADVDVRATHNALLPVLTLSGQYSSVGLSGNSIDTATGVVTKEGWTTAQSQVFHNEFPDYYGQLTLQLPLRNRSAQADNQRAILTQRQLQAQIQQLKNAAVLDVRNTYVALEQNRARVDAASKARELQQQTFEAEQKKYQLGASTVYNVILTQRDFIAAQGTELRALADLVEAKANYERALGRTLDVNHVTVADAKTGDTEPDTLIPGTLHGKVVGMDQFLKSLSDAGQK